MQSNHSKNMLTTKGNGYASPLNLFLSFVLLVALVFSVVNVTSAWFTDDSSSGKTISATIRTSEANLNVYQEDSSGTQTMLSKALPTEYTQLEYIATTGTQYIDTGFKPTPNTVKYETTISFDDITGARGVFGARVGSPSNQSVNVFCINSSASSAYLRLDWADSGSSSTYSVRAGNKYTFLCFQNSVTVNNTIKTGTIEKSMTQLDGNFYVGNFNNGTAAPYANGMIGKIYYGRLYDNGTLMRNLIPAKNSSGVLGMYDLVENKFYTNAGTGTFVAGAEQKTGSGISLAYDSTNKTNNKISVANLPAGYTQLEYLQSDGNQKFDTGIKPSSNMRFVGKSYFQRPTTGADNYLFGSGSSYSNFVGLMVSKGGGVWTGVGSKTACKADIAVEDYYTFNFDYSYNETTAVLSSNLVNCSLTYSDSVLTTANIYLFDRSTTGGIWLTRFYSFTMYSENVLVRDFVPAKNASGVLGMYDLVEGKFYTNSGSGSFTAGNEVNVNKLKLLLKNEDLGSSFGVRYKVTFYAVTPTGKQLLSSSISGMTAPTSSSNGFALNSTDGYYYYQDSSGNNVEFEPATSTTTTSKYLMTGFTINYDSTFVNLLGGNAIYMEISIESVNIS